MDEEFLDEDKGTTIYTF